MIEEERVIIHEKVKLFLAKRQSTNNNCSFQCSENSKYDIYISNVYKFPMHLREMNIWKNKKKSQITLLGQLAPQLPPLRANVFEPS